MHVFTIGYSKRTAPEFFGALRQAGIKRCVDVRLGNTSQLAGFTKQTDLPFFLKELCDIEYVAEPLLAPTRDMVDLLRKRKGSWAEYERRFLELITQREIEAQLARSVFAVSTVLLCVESTAEHCHRRLVLEYLREHWGDLSITHL
jgi:uncharacterized protein (DUF488 family)